MSVLHEASAIGSLARKPHGLPRECLCSLRQLDQEAIWAWKPHGLARERLAGAIGSFARKPCGLAVVQERACT